MESNEHFRSGVDDALIGIAAGDALGVTSEFVPQNRIPELYRQFGPGGWPFTQVGGGWLDLPPGGHSDDTDMSLCIYQSYKTLDRFDPADIAKRFVSWMQTGPRDIGSTVLRALSQIAGGSSWLDAGKTSYFMSRGNAPNGSLMRNGLMAHMAPDLHTSFTFSLKQGMITHYSPLTVICCCAQTYLIRGILETGVMPLRWIGDFRQEWDRWLDSENDPVVLDWTAVVSDRMELAWRQFMSADFDPNSFDPFYVSYTGRSGYCLLTLQIAIWALHWASSKEDIDLPGGYPKEVFEKRGAWTLGWIAMLGYDSDTYCATAGPMLSALHGGLPEEMTSDLLIHDWI